MSISTMELMQLLILQSLCHKMLQAALQGIIVHHRTRSTSQQYKVAVVVCTHTMQDGLECRVCINAQQNVQECKYNSSISRCYGTLLWQYSSIPANSECSHH